MSVRSIKSSNRMQGYKSNGTGFGNQLHRSFEPACQNAGRKLKRENSFLTARKVLERENTNDPRKAKLQSWKAEKEARKAKALKERNLNKPALRVVPTKAATAIDPRKDLGMIFADEGKTSFLTDMLAEMTVDPSAAMTTANEPKPGPVNDTPPTLITTSPSISKRFRVDDQKPEPVKQGTYFRQQAQIQKNSLEELALHWAEFEKKTKGISAEWRGEITVSVGQASLLCGKRMKQFFGLCDLNEAAAPPSDGLTARTTDLDGFWDVIMMQVDDVKKMFEKLEVQKAEGWVDKEEPTRAPKKKKRAKTMKSKPALARLKSGSKPGPVTPRTKAAKGRMAAFRDKMRNRAFSATVCSVPEEEPAQASLSMLTPVRASKKEQDELGTSVFLTSVRRSSRKTPSRYRSEIDQQNVAKMLAAADYSYKPNPALQQQPLYESPQSADSATLGIDVDANGNPLAKHLFSDSAEQAETPSSLRSSRRSPVLQGFMAPAGTGSVKKFVARTPSARMREHLGTDVIFTPVRRSRRLEDSTTEQNCVEQVSDLPGDSGYMPNPSLPSLF